PLASFVVAVACVVLPTVRLEDASDTAVVATGTGVAVVTVTAELPVTPSLVAVMVDVPAATAVHRPGALTGATMVLEIEQLIVRPVSRLFVASFVVAFACVV